MDKMTLFGKRLKELRTKKNLKQEDLAKTVGMSQSAISQFEKGQRFPNQSNIEKLSSALDVSKEELVMR